MATMTSEPVFAPSSGRALAASIGKNTAFGVVGSVVHLIARLLVVPVAVKHLGLDGFGIWSVLMTVAAYMSLGSAGVKSAFQKYAAEATGNGEFDQASRLISTGTAAVTLLSIVVLVPLAIFAKPLAVAVGVPMAFLPAATKSIVFLAFAALMSNIGQAFQSILMGAHRIDLREKINIILDPASAVVTIALLYMGFGLFSMCVVFSAYELVGSVIWYFLSRRVLPQVHVAPRFVTRSVVPELIRFGGSYQLVSMFEALLAAVLPITILKFFGAESAGIFALAFRVVTIAGVIQGSYLQAILSGGSAVFASNSPEQTNAFIVKSFKAMSAITIIPLAFIALYGTQIAMVWTGRSDPLLRATIWLLCAGGICRSLSSLCRVLYRVSGGAVMDNVQLILALAVAFALSPLAPHIGFLPVVGGVAFGGQFLGLIVMGMSLTYRFKGFHAWVLAPNLIRFCVATLAMLAASIVASYIGVHSHINSRTLATVHLFAATAICLLVAGPALLLTGSISRNEARMMWNTISRKLKFAPAA